MAKDTEALDPEVVGQGQHHARSSAQRVDWFKRGMDSGELGACGVSSTTTH